MRNSKAQKKLEDGSLKVVLTILDMLASYDVITDISETQYKWLWEEYTRWSKLRKKLKPNVKRDNKL